MEEESPVLTNEGAFIKEGEQLKDKDLVERPEESIPDLPENQKARDFLRKAPKKGLPLPMGVEVKVMQCFRCKAYGHRTNDRECPMRISGNIRLDSERQEREDPMSSFVLQKMQARNEKYARVEELKALLDTIREEEKARKIKKKNKKDKKKVSKHKDKHREKEKYPRQYNATELYNNPNKDDNMNKRVRPS
eukprot:gene9118-12299_t